MTPRVEEWVFTGTQLERRGRTPIDVGEFVYGTDKAATIAAAGLSGPTPNTVTGNLVITTPGTVVENTIVTGWVELRANNITLRNVKILVGSALMGTYSPPTQAGIFAMYDTTGHILEHVEIAPDTPTVDTYGIIGGGYTGRHLDIHDCVDAIQINKAQPVILEGGHLHGGRHYAVDPRQVDGSHGDMIQLIMGSLTITGTVIDTGAGPGTGSNFGVIATQNTTTPITNLTIDKAWFTGSSYSQVKVEQKARGVIPTTITGSRFQQDATNPLIHGTAASITAATITGNTGPDGLALPGSEVWADGSVA